MPISDSVCWGLTSQSTIFQSCRDGATASWVINKYFRGVKCLAQGHNTAAVGFEPSTSRSGVDTLPLSHRAPLISDSTYLLTMKMSQAVHHLITIMKMCRQFTTSIQSWRCAGSSPPQYNHEDVQAVHHLNTIMKMSRHFTTSLQSWRCPGSSPPQYNHEDVQAVHHLITIMKMCRQFTTSIQSWRCPGSSPPHYNHEDVQAVHHLNTIMKLCRQFTTSLQSWRCAGSSPPQYNHEAVQAVHHFNTIMKMCRQCHSRTGQKVNFCWFLASFTSYFYSKSTF